jgi:hypothetical protein
VISADTMLGEFTRLHPGKTVAPDALRVAKQ